MLALGVFLRRCRFNILSNNTDREGKTFVSSMEGKGGLPVYTTQYHPEKASDCKHDCWGKHHLPC